MKTSLSPVQTRLATNSYCDEQTTAARSIRRHAVADDRVSMIPPGTRKEQITRRNKETRINGGVSSKPDWAAQYELGLGWNRILFWFFFSYQSIELHRTFDPLSIPSNRTDSDRIVQNTNANENFRTDSLAFQNHHANDKITWCDARFPAGQYFNDDKFIAVVPQRWTYAYDRLRACTQYSYGKTGKSNFVLRFFY